MADSIILSIALIFIALAIIFVGITLQDFLKENKKFTIARKTWLRMAFIFCGIGIGLLFCNMLLK